MNPDTYVSDDEYWDERKKGFSFDDPNERFSSKTGDGDSWNTTKVTKSDRLHGTADNIKGDASSYASEDFLKINLSDAEIASPKYVWILDMHSEKEAKEIQLSSSKVIENMILGLNVNLENFKSLASKRDLLRSAIKSHDGNAILTVLLFLKSSLKDSLFSQEILSSHEDAQNSYIAFLKQSQKFEELEHLLMLLSKDEDAAMLKYERVIHKLRAPEVKRKGIQSCYSTHFEMSSASRFNILSVAEHVRLLNDQFILKQFHDEHCPGEDLFFSINHKALIDSSVIDTFIFCCLYYYDKKWPIHSNLATFKTAYDLTPKQCTWAAVRALTVLQRWPCIDEYFTSEKWFGSRKMRSGISFSNVVKTLQKLGAPAQLLWRYVEFIKDEEKRLEIAKRVKCHRVVIEILSRNKDRLALEEYKSTLRPSTPEEVAVTVALRNTKIKWRN
ncbi:spermatogenesis-defective protein 39 homolog [Uloborus diversus]|uniref:spermatogenesis-defective protein 39 homolog n=1 Tax=Uloborus diversus TaxID=327109 RepID=UPI00240A93CE|nr:spermatogenesis-defective protein 39 homolog [Uloborus diversus]